MVEKIDDLNLLELKARPASFMIFDLDGTLVETDYANYLSYKSAIEQVAKCKCSLAYDPHKRVTREAIKAILPDLSDENHEEIIAIKETSYQNYLHETKLNLRVSEITDKFSYRKMVLATNSRKERAFMLRRHHQLVGKFSYLFYRENLNSGINKFQKVLSALQANGNTVLVFENNQSEIDDAVSAGILSENIFKVK